MHAGDVHAGTLFPLSRERLVGRELKAWLLPA